MKKLLLFIVFIISITANAQQVTNVYKNKTIKLVAKNDFAQGNDWAKIFRSYYDTTFYGKQIGKNKSLIVLDNGRIVVNNIYRNYYTVFNVDGVFNKEMHIKNTDGKIIKKTRSIYGTINNTFYTNADNMGNVLCFDFNGKLVKKLKLNYSVRQIITLSNTKLAVVGWSIWKDKFRDFVAIVDYNTNKQKIVWTHFTSRAPKEKRRFNYSYTFSNGYMVSLNTMPFTKVTGLSIPPIIQSIDNELIVAVPSSGEIFTYNIKGEQVNSSKIQWAKNYMSVEEQKIIQRKAIEKYKKLLGHKIVGSISLEENNQAINSIIEKMKTDLNNINDKLQIPVFSTVIKDSENNLLFFEIAEKTNQNKFNVWTMDNKGEFIAKSSFICDDYNLEITPDKMVFHNGYIYSLQTKKNVKGNPLRLVKFKLITTP